MLVFVCLTNILLITSLISLLSASLSRVRVTNLAVSVAADHKIHWLTLFHQGNGACPRRVPLRVCTSSAAQQQAVRRGFNPAISLMAQADTLFSF
jgi:hypothetical protein